MDDAWPARWPPPPTLQQPSPALAPALPSLPSQMDSINLRYHLRPFAAVQMQETAAADGRTAARPEQLLSNPWSSLPGLPEKAGPSNPLLAQVPGNYYPHVSHVPDLKALLDKPNASSGAGVVDHTRDALLGGATPLQNKYPRHGLSGSSRVEQSSLGALFLNKSSNAHDDTLPGEGLANDGMSQGVVQFQDSSAHTMQKLPSKSIPRQHPAHLGDRTRVSCLNVGGEFFVGEAGLFGVLCLCHQLRMSVAKFCEHSGGPAEKAGEIVRMENGMSIAQWLKYCLGASVTDTKWDWPEWACMDYSPEGYRLKSLLTRNSSMEKIGLFGGYGKITGPINRTVYSNDLYNEGRGCTTFEKLVNKQDETYYKKSADVHTAFTKNYALLQHSEMNSGLAKIHTDNAVNINPVSRPSGSPYFTANTGGNYKGNYLAYNYADLLERNFEASFHNLAPSSTGVLSYDSRACRSYFPNKILQDSLGSASNTELKLGQSSYHQSMTSLFPPVQSTTIDFQKPQSHLPLITQNPCPSQKTKVTKSIEELTEPPFGTGNKKQSIEVANRINHAEGDELTDDTTKNSFISLFLSHLERNSEAIDDILNSNEHNLPKALDGACSSKHSKIASGQVEPRSNDNHSKLASAIIHSKRRSDGRSLLAEPSGYVPKAVPLANSQEPLIHSDYQSDLQPSQPNAGISKIGTGVSCPAICRSCNHVGSISHRVAHAETGPPRLYDKMARGHNTFECVDDLCSHKSLTVAKIICQCGNSCSPSREFLPSFGRNEQSTLGQSIHRCRCEVQEDVSKLGFRTGHLCQNHFSNDSAPICTPAVGGLDELCTCSTFISRSSLCSREHVLQSSCLARPLDGFHYRSSLGHATNSLTKYPLLDAPKKKESGPCWDGRCCYSVVPKCLADCGFTKHCDVRIDQSGSTVQNRKHDVQLPARCCTLGESEKLRCLCSSNVIPGSSNAQTSFLEDVSNKMANQPYFPISERLKNVSEESVARDSWPYGVITEEKSSCRGSGISKEQLKSGFSCGSSSAVVTKFSASPEFNNISSCMAKYGVEHKKAVYDEGSRIEKCSSSSYVPISTRCEKALNSFSHLGTSKVKRKCNQISDGSTLKEDDNEEQCFETRKKSRTLRCSTKPDERTRRITFQSSQNGDSQPQNVASSFSCRVSKRKRKHSSMQLKPVKRLHSHHKILKGDDEQSDDKGISIGDLNSSDRKKQVEDITTLDRTKYQEEASRVFVRKLPKYVSLNCIVNEPNSEDSCRGIAHVDSSLIATGITNDNRKFPKIVPLNLILKKAKRCHAVKPLCKTENIHSEKKRSLRSVDGNYNPQAEDGMHSSKRNRYSSNALRPHVEAHCKSPCNDLGEGEPIGLTDVETSQLSVSTSRTGAKNRRSSVSLNRIKRREEFANGSACSPYGDKDNALQAWEVNVGRYKEMLSSDDSCCVCENPNLEPCNKLIGCSKCYIKVHQACYGVLKVPRGQWFCRPCKMNTQDTVCVLCGYGGGAMTRALKTQNVVKSLLKGLTPAARPDRYVHSSGNASNECASDLHGEDVTRDPFYTPRSTSLDTISTSDVQKPIDSAHEENIVSNSWATNHNSSLLGLQTMQWVHVVCGLWTPGTKCPNATTMSAFDISGASPAKRNIACSMCNRTGGSFMECRDISCSVLFHPWCAHQRGLLQSEPEGEHYKNIGFYGRCLDHAILHYANHVNPKNECLRSNYWTCARTEGFKGRKGEGWSGSNYKKPQENSGEYSVSQEQINAWLRINGSKPCIRGQNDYIHYKQLKGWKHLVVYKSGIHGLGLYTSEFIPRGSMVIEYVGEIVGQRVADKREVEYQRQQYKTACYFFKIDKEHIIDATRKGGIARFINHSCLPSCVAKIISVRSEKKVVFYAERHINPGEEITYDYHFNQEDEGQRIPCFCRSRSCRRYLN